MSKLIKTSYGYTDDNFDLVSSEPNDFDLYTVYRANDEYRSEPLGTTPCEHGYDLSGQDIYRLDIYAMPGSNGPDNINLRGI